MAQSPEKYTIRGVSSRPPHGVLDSITFLVLMFDSSLGVFPTREAHMSFGVQSPY